MSEQTVTSEAIDLAERFPGKVSAETRPGYTGYMVTPPALIETVRFLKEDQGYDYLSSVTAVDYYPQDIIEVVYHFYKTSGGPALILRTQTPRDASTVPSLVGLYPGAEFQEREAWDLMGVRFTDHPDLRRILLWEGFAGYPLRKDWKEPFFEEEGKPYKSRWPEGHVTRAEDHNPFGDNVQYPDHFDPDQWDIKPEDALYNGLSQTMIHTDSELTTDRLIVNLGPQHPSTHGVFRMAAMLEGETIVSLKPVMGYMHRNHEKIGERNTYLGIMPFTDRLDYISSMSNNFGYAVTVEKLMGITPPERAEYIRVIMAELTRINSHLIAIGFLLNDLGAFFTPSLYGLSERELILDIFEETAGSRMMCNYFRFGGVSRDLPEGVLAKIHDLAYDRLPRKLDEFRAYLADNEIVRSRCEGVGALTAEQAIGLSAAGPILRAAGVPYDLRRADPYSIYDRFDFDVAVGENGDVMDRFLVRFEEINQSIRILQQAVKDIPEGPIQTGKPAYQVRVPAGEAYGHIEGPKGELGYYVVSNGKPNPVRYHVRAPSFINLTALETMCIGHKVADAVVILGSVDIVLGEVDR